jgi:23S rRNA (adenine2030-N6)-methyltransferase
MNYRHIYHAGNFADVLKHTALVSILLHLRKKEKAFTVVDTHAGSGLYDIAGHEAGRTKEAERGIGRLLGSTGLPGVLSRYCDIVRSFSPQYPGSPLIAAKLLRAQDRLVAIEMHPEEFEELKAALAKFPRARAVQADGYREVKSLLPPPERRGLVLIDPPYEADDEFVAAARALADAYRRFATGIYLLWYPLKTRQLADAAAGELMNAGVKDILRIELDVDAAPAPAREGRVAPLSKMGLLVVNGPHGFEEEMKLVLPALAKQLALGPNPRFRLERLAGEP